MTAVAHELSKGPALSIISLVEALAREAFESRTSDIHIDPTALHLRVRFRIDGVLQEGYILPLSLHEEIISRIKVLAQLRTDEHQATQDGRFHLNISKEDSIDMRVSIMPTYYGENAVMRILSNRVSEDSLTSLGFSKSNQKKIFSALSKPYGMILATGPTGSGKTTTLYSLIKMINRPEVSILTLEDPIEYSISNIRQIQVNTRAGLTFANGLRSMLRQDPNIIMVGEIRDAETASIAINTALTGHLLLSTLHTNDSATTLPRLLDMGIDRYLVASTVTIAIAQRLVRKICIQCKEAVPLTPSMVEALSDIPLIQKISVGEVLYHGVGCPGCKYSGYSGRISVNEVLVADDAIRERILKKASASDIRLTSIAQGMTPMLEDGFQKVRDGVTTVEEILRVLYE